MRELKTLGSKDRHQLNGAIDPRAGVGNGDVESLRVAQPGDESAEAHPSIDFRHARGQGEKITEGCSTRTAGIIELGFYVNAKFPDRTSDEIRDRLAGVRTQFRDKSRYLREGRQGLG